MTPAYELRTRRERFGALELVVATLADLDRAVDDLLRRVEEHPDELERDLCPYFGVIWPAARALAEALARRGPALAGRTVLEVGCGLALPSIVAVRLGARVKPPICTPTCPPSWRATWSSTV